MKRCIRLCLALTAAAGLAYLVYRNRLAIRGLLRTMWTKYRIRRSECEEFEDL